MPTEDCGLASSRRCRWGRATRSESHGAVAHLHCHPEPAFFAPRGIWAGRAKRRITLRRNNRAFGSLPYLLLGSNAKIHRIRVHPAGANVDGNLAPEIEVVRRNRDHDLLCSDERRELRVAVPEHNRVYAEIVAVNEIGR